MSDPLLLTKLYIPPARANLVPRSRLVERLKDGLAAGRKLTLISAPAGFGKTTLVSEWVAGCGRPVAWLTLDEGDNDSTRFLAYLVAALQTLAPKMGAGVLNVLQAPQPPPIESILTTLLNEITTLPHDFILVLDDYHAADSRLIDEALTFLLKHLPPQMHLAITTREDPRLPLASLRARGQLTELRAADLRFTPAEAAEFLNQMMGLNLCSEDITALETRTEGWIAGLQLAALAMLAMQGHQDTASFIQSFTGSHHFVLDYLIEEVLQQQPENVQNFLLATSILDRMCGPLCDAVLCDASVSGQETLEYIEQANLFIIPLDNERRWYRYHHLFADLLRQRLHQVAASSSKDGKATLAEYHIRASAWYEAEGLNLEAFHHAAAANDIERAARLMEGRGIPVHFHYAVTTILGWLASLPESALDTRPLLWVRYATLSLVAGHTTGVEEKLQAAEAALEKVEPDDRTRDLIGQIAAARATLALTQYRIEDIIAQSHRALAYLPADNLAFRFTAIWTLGVARQFQGDRAAAGQAYAESLSICQMSGNNFSTILAMTGLGQVQELENQLHQAAATYQRVLHLIGDYPLPNACEAYLGLARIGYEWNDLDAAERYGLQSLRLAQQFDQAIDRSIVCEVFLARLKLAQGDAAGAAVLLAQTDKTVHQHHFVHRMPEVAAAQVQILLQQGNLAEAAYLAQAYPLPVSQARVHLARGNTSAALALLEPLRQQMEAKGWMDELLKVMVLQAVALHTHGEKGQAAQLLADALALAQPGGFIRIFVDEGTPMANLLLEAASHEVMPDYTGTLLAVFEAQKRKSHEEPGPLPAAPQGYEPLVEPLSQRELKILQLIAQGLSNREIGERLFLALDTVKGHNRRIFEKLQVQRRTEAVARARKLGLL